MFSLKSGSICWKASTTHGFADSTWNWFQFQAQWVNSESMHDLVHMRWCHCLMGIVGSSLSPSGHIAIVCSSILVEFIDCTYQVDNPSWVKKLSSQSFVQVRRDMGPCHQQPMRTYPPANPNSGEHSNSMKPWNRHLESFIKDHAPGNYAA